MSWIVSGRPRDRRLTMACGAAVAMLLTAAVAVIVGCDHDAAQADTEADGVRAVNVVVASAVQAEFEDALMVQGNVQAKRLALVSPRVAGVLDEIFVDEGDWVEAGKTRLFQTDSVKLAEAFEMRRDEVVVAESSLREKRASLERDQADFDKAEYDWNRYRELYEQGAASNDELEDAETTYKRCAATLKHARALVSLAEAQLGQARAALAIAEKDLADSLVLAPISGVVAERFHEPGEMGGPGNAVLRIEDPTLLEVSVFLPAQVYDRVAAGQTPMRVTVNGVELGNHAVTYKSPTIDARLRTFEVRCLVHDPPPTVAPGSLAHVRVVLEKRRGLGVPRDALQRRGGQTVVFVAAGQTARMVPVQVGLESDGLVEVESDGLSEGSPVVALGGYFLNPDAPIKVQSQER